MQLGCHLFFDFLINFSYPIDDNHRNLQSARANPRSSTKIALPPMCAKGKTVVSEANIRSVYRDVKAAFHALIERSPAFAQSNIYGAALRLAFHDAGEIDITKGDKFGPDGCLSNSGDNAGLIEEGTVPVTVIEPLWQEYCDKISRADFWALLGKLAAERADPTHTLIIPFQYGRKDAASCDDGVGRLPKPQPGLSEYDRVFVKQMGLSIADAVALVGAHTVGHVHPEHSGYGTSDDLSYFTVNYAENAWDESPEAFDNQYHKSLLLEVSSDNKSLRSHHIYSLCPIYSQLWENEINSTDPTSNTWHVAVNRDGVSTYEPKENIDALAFNPVAGGGEALEGGNNNALLADQALAAAEPGFKIALGADAFIGVDRRRLLHDVEDSVDEQAEHQRSRRLASRNFLHPRTIMLNSDMALAYPAHFDKNNVTQADGTTVMADTGLHGELCGGVLAPESQIGCQSEKYGIVTGYPSTFLQVKKYSEDNDIFLKDFAAAYVKMTTAGYAIKPGPIKEGKLGTLKSIDLGPYWVKGTSTISVDGSSSASSASKSTGWDYLSSPYGKKEDICPHYDGVTYYVKGFPGTPYKLTPFVNGFSNPIEATPMFTECREDGHCVRSYEIDVYPVQARVFDQSLPGCQNHPGTWFLTYNGSVPGPTIVMPTGHESLVRFNNKITPGGPLGFDFHPCDGEGRKGRPFSVHFHGSASLAPYDGWADDNTCFNETKDYVYPNNRPNTGWFHDHAAHVTGENAYDGLAGFYIISSKVYIFTYMIYLYVLILSRLGQTWWMW